MPVRLQVRFVNIVDEGNVGEKRILTRKINMFQKCFYTVWDITASSSLSRCCVAHYSQYCCYHVSVTRIGYNVFDQSVNVVCTTRNMFCQYIFSFPNNESVIWRLCYS